MMQSDTLLHVANVSTLLVCMVLKFPQIFVLLRAKSTTGLSIKSLVLELIGPLLWYIVFVTYQMYYDYPPPTYLEYPILIAQDVVLLLLILLYGGRLQDSLLYSVVFVVGWRLLTVEKWIIDFAMNLCTFISAASKFAQLQCLWRSKDAGQVSALTWALATYTCMTRIYTTVVTTGDMQVLVRFIAMTLLNLWVLLSVLYYRRHGCSPIKED
ncbi:solute carrier family 66 member 3 isoform X1 [Phyllopteryx taeniolatus]|uniref:solute carrier family 66 member 3 isoform X1 n=1 Tax=Phyllopteryx taeniolatus TaxID=161469 RepID=UPI002AD412CF|nr:solute carrier family 66 member 3 isoform X1 [Phyllopteryx taeniolatus]